MDQFIAVLLLWRVPSPRFNVVSPTCSVSLSRVALVAMSPLPVSLHERRRFHSQDKLTRVIGMFTVVRPLRGGEVFSSAVRSRYPIDIIWKGSLFPIPFGIRLQQNVIKTETRKFKLSRRPAGTCRTAIQSPTHNSLLRVMLRRHSETYI